MNDPIFGDSCITCHTLPTSAALIMKALKGRVEQLEVQLAGCGSAAQGWTLDAKLGDYGWSPSYQEVVNLRKKWDEMQLHLS